MLSVLLLFIFSVSAVQSIEFVFESVKLLSGFEYIESTLRVRKFNRTSVVLNGTLFFKQPIDDTSVVTMDVFHSRLGNQQFNYYPMKLPSQGACKFLYGVYDNYEQYFDGLLNTPPKGQCPILPREVHFANKEFPSESLPPVIRQGLWKVFLTTKINGVEKLKFEIMVKAYADTFH